MVSRNGAERKYEPLKNIVRKSVGLSPFPVGVGGHVIQLHEQEEAVPAKEEAAIVGTYNMAIEVSNLKQQITDITNGLKRLDADANSKVRSIAHISEHLMGISEKVDQLEGKIEQIEKVKIAQFKDNDVYEVNKRIERLEAKVALINSNLFNNRIARFFLAWADDYE